MGGEVVQTSPRLIRAAGTLILLAASASACDIVQGFQNAGDALFPPVKTYLDAPGYQLIAGGYKDLNFVAGDELYLLARSSAAEDRALYSMRYADPTPCTIPEVSTYFPAEDPDGGTTWINYFHDLVSRGELSFADLNCKPSSLVLSDAQLPFAVRSWVTPSGAIEADSARNLILRQGDDIVAVDPAEPSTEVLVKSAGQVMQAVGGASVNYVVSENVIVALDSSWRFLRTFGTNVSQPAVSSGRLYYQDNYVEDGVEKTRIVRVTSSFSGDTTVFDPVTIAEDGCQFSFPAPSQRWLAFYSPCADRRLVIWPEDSGPAVELDLPTEPWLMLLVPDPKPAMPGPVTPSLDRLFAFYLRPDDVDYHAGVGTLMLRARGEPEITIGARAAMERTSVSNDSEYGYALVDSDVDGERGRYIRWFTADGSNTEVAPDALREAAQPDWARLIIEWDGTSGTLAKAVEGDLIRVLERVPRRRYAYDDGQYTALFGDYDGSVGTLSIGKEVCPPDPPNCAARYFAPNPVAYGVRHPRHRLFNEIGAWLPAIGYLTAFDQEHATGRFEYRNLELGFTSIVSEGVSDFLIAGNGILYAVPFGAGAGIWLARAK
jgi:hypothetical protein